MPLTAGTRLGPYEIIGPLGAGGMGEVYRGRDTRLQRDVALKLVSESFAGDPNRLARFEREAQTLASLNHPNIAQVYGLEGAALVMELLDGDTLTARLSAGPLPVRKAIEHGIQIARGLAAAHDRGIIHRDLKPDNIFVLRDGHVKIIDFGLARESAPPASGATAMHTIARTSTEPGTVMGTVGYMAPEQVRADAVDARADLFALGAVLYEMLAGKRAFARETPAETMTAILREDPEELMAARREVSPALERVVRHCLEKNPVERFQTARDVAFALETLSTATTSSSPAIETGGRPRPRAPWLPWAVAAVAVIGAATWGYFARSGAPPEKPWGYFTRVTESAGEETAPALSPDGTTVAYAVQVNGSWDIVAQRVGGRNATPIVNDPQRDESGPAYSPDGSLIAFHESDVDGGIFIAGATGESVRRVTDLGFHPAWSPDGRQIAFDTEEIFEPASRQAESFAYVVAGTGGATRKLLETDAVQPSWSPSGERIAYWSNTGGQRDIYTIAASGGSPVAVTDDAAIDWSPTWSPDGRFIYFSSDRGVAMNLWRIAVDQTSGRVLGSAEPVTAGVQATAGLPRFSKDGSRMAFRSRVASANPVAIPFDPATHRAGTPIVLDTSNNFRLPTGVSPDGKQIAYGSLGDHQEDLFVGSADGTMRRVTDDAARDRSPVFTPDGRSLVFYSNRTGIWGLWTIGIDGGGLRSVSTPPSGAVYAIVSPRGDAVAFVDNSSTKAFTVPLAATPGTPAELPNTVTGGMYFNPTDWSRDGARLTGLLTSVSGRPSGVGVYDLSAHVTTMVSADPAYAVKWLSDSRHAVYFTNGGRQLIVVDTVTRTRTAVDVRLPAPAADEMFAISPDDRTIYYGGRRAEADIWIAERK